MKTENKKILIATVAFFVFIIVISFLYILLSQLKTNKNPQSDPSITEIYVDPGSGETVISTPNLTPEKAGGPDVVALGFLKLLDIGVSSDQFSAIKSDFLDYSLSQKTPIREISITTASIRDTANPSTAERTLEFTVTIDRESTLNAKVYYVGIGEPTLTLYDPINNKQVYISN